VNDNIDPDLVVTTASDADSSGDSKVNATSIDGEDELVDVTMNGVNVRRSIEQSESEPSKSGSVRGQELYVFSAETFYLFSIIIFFTHISS
jgi:hypothetical protein